MNSSKYIDEVQVYSDGGCKPNPGVMVGAFVVTDGQNIIKGPISFELGQGTNIVAEFKAIEKALDETVACTRKKVFVHCDNEFVVKALNKERRITKRIHLKPIIADIYKKSTLFTDVSYIHVSEKNKYIMKCDSECGLLLTRLGI